MSIDMVHVAICDDEITVADYIENMFLTISKREGILLEMDVFCSGKELEKEICNGTVYVFRYLKFLILRKNSLQHH